MARDNARMTDVADVRLNGESTYVLNADGTYSYPKGVKGPAKRDTFEVHPNLRDAKKKGRNR